MYYRSVFATLHFHAVVGNDTAYQMLYCLLNGKTQPIYARLLSLIEKTANERQLSVFNRRVHFMDDFEKAVINATQVYEARNGVVGCLFHFTKNIRKGANRSIERSGCVLGRRRKKHEHRNGSKRCS